MRFYRKNIAKLNEGQYCVTIPTECNKMIEKNWLNKSVIVEISDPTITDLKLLDKETKELKEKLAEWMTKNPDADVTDIIKDEE